MTEIFVARSDDMSEGARRVVECEGRQIGVVRAKGKLHAFLNICPHQGGPVCDGLLINRVEEIIAPDKTYQGQKFSDDLHFVCPWHGYEYDIRTGECVGNRKLKLRKYDVVRRGEDIFVVA